LTCEASINCGSPACSSLGAHLEAKTWY
jgi:hypothetical protein